MTRYYYYYNATRQRGRSLGGVQPGPTGSGFSSGFGTGSAVGASTAKGNGSASGAATGTASGGAAGVTAAMSGAGVATGAAVWGAATAPVISWDNTNQVLVVDFDESSVVVGNIAYVQFFSDAGLTTLVSTAVVVLDAANILSGILNVVAGLGAGTYYARAFVSGSSWSNTATVTITSGGSVPTFYILGF